MQKLSDYCGNDSGKQQPRGQDKQIRSREEEGEVSADERNGGRGAADRGKGAGVLRVKEKEKKDFNEDNDLNLSDLDED